MAVSSISGVMVVPPPVPSIGSTPPAGASGSSAAAADECGDRGFFWNPAVKAATSSNTHTSPSQSELGLLNKLPLEQQQLIFAGQGQGQGFASLDAWKVQIAKDQATRHAEFEDDHSSPSAAPGVTASRTVSVAPSKAPTSVAALALATLTLTKSTGSDAEVALAILRNAAKAAATAKAASHKNTSDKTPASPNSSETPGATRDLAANKMGDTVSVTA